MCVTLQCRHREVSWPCSCPSQAIPSAVPGFWGIPPGSCCVCGVTTTPSHAQHCANECTHPSDRMLVFALLAVSSNTFLSCPSTHDVWRFPGHKKNLRFLSAAVRGKAIEVGEREKWRISNVTASLSNMQEPVSWQRCVHYLSKHYQ